MRILWEVNFPRRSETGSPCIDDAISKYRPNGSAKKIGVESPCAHEAIPKHQRNGSTQKRAAP